MKIQFDTDGFIRALEQYADRKEKQIVDGLTKAALEVERKARAKCPKDTTALRQSITHDVRPRGPKVTAIVGSELEYAPYVHEGTGIHSRTGMGRQDVPWSYQDEKGDWHTTDGMEPRPFLEEARNECKDRISQIMFDALKG